MTNTSLNLLRGTVDLLILKSLTWEARHGYAISEWIDTVTEGTLLMEEGTLYPALHRLERKRWIESEWGLSDNNRRARFYQLTAAGRGRLASEATTWQRYSDAVAKALAMSGPHP
jgi:PadR family transcriptional regulator